MVRSTLTGRSDFTSVCFGDENSNRCTGLPLPDSGEFFDDAADAALRCERVRGERMGGMLAGPLLGFPLVCAVFDDDASFALANELAVGRFTFGDITALR